jgi:transcriptional regulator with XRE-family HTH domain
MEPIIKAISERLRGMRDILGLSEADMAAATDITAEEYRALESGEKDFSFTFLYKAAHRLGIDLTELLTGETPHRTGYTLVRKGEGLPIERRAGFHYLNLAPYFRGRLAEPFLVTAPCQDDTAREAISQNSHAGQEIDHVLTGSLRVRIGQHEEILHAGDTLYYDSGRPHGMVAIGGEPCRFLAIVIDEPIRTGREESTC